MFGYNGMNCTSFIPVAVNDGGYGRNNGLGDDWGWILLLALFGEGGFGNWGGNRGQVATTGDVQRGFDTQTIVGKLDRLGDGLCSLGYDQLAQINGVNQNISNQGSQTREAITQQTITQMQNANAAARQLDNCCCENRQAIADVKYTMASDTCAITGAIRDAARAGIDNDNENYRRLEARLDQIERNADKRYIAELEAKLNRCDRDNAIQAMGNYIVDRLDPRPYPAYDVPGPWWAQTNQGYNNRRCCDRAS